MPSILSEGKQDMIRRNSGFVSNSTFTDVHFSNGELDFRGFWKSLSWRDGQKYSYYGGSSYMDYAVYGEIKIEDTFSGLSIGDAASLPLNFNLDPLNSTRTTTTLLSVGNQYSTRLAIEAQCTDLSFTNPGDGKVYKKTNLVVKPYGFAASLSCTAGDSVDISTQNDLAGQSKTLRVLIHADKMQYADSGSLMVDLQLLEGGSFVLKTVCTLAFTPAELADFKVADILAGNIVGALKPDITVPSLFRVTYKDLYFLAGPKPELNSPARR